MYRVKSSELIKLLGISMQCLLDWRDQGRLPVPDNVGCGDIRPRYLWDLEKVAKFQNLDAADLINSHKKLVDQCARGKKI